MKQVFRDPHRVRCLFLIRFKQRVVVKSRAETELLQLKLQLYFFDNLVLSKIDQDQ